MKHLLQVTGHPAKDYQFWLYAGGKDTNVFI